MDFPETDYHPLRNLNQPLEVVFINIKGIPTTILINPNTGKKYIRGSSGELTPILFPKDPGYDPRTPNPLHKPRKSI